MPIQKRISNPKTNENFFRGHLYTEFAYSKTEFRATTAASIGAPSFRRTQAPFASTTTSCSCSPWFFVLLFPHDKNFAFIFDMQALVRLFLPCGSPCVRSTSDCAVLLRSRRTKRSGTAFSRFVLQTSRMPFVACNELAIVTKSIASVCPHAERTPWVPFQVGTTVWAALSNTSGECVVAKANEADCGAQTPKSKHVRKGGSLIWVLPPTLLR